PGANRSFGADESRLRKKICHEEKPKITQLNSGSMNRQVISASLITGLTAGAYAYAAQSPTSQIFGRTVIAGSDIHELALTFDDGPNDPYTLELLELLARHP